MCFLFEMLLEQQTPKVCFLTTFDQTCPPQFTLHLSVTFYLFILNSAALPVLNPLWQSHRQCCAIKTLTLQIHYYWDGSKNPLKIKFITDHVFMFDLISSLLKNSSLPAAALAFLVYSNEEKKYIKPSLGVFTEVILSI